MKKYLLLIFAFVATLLMNEIHSQSVRTVEVTVKDTVFLKTTKITYKITFENIDLYAAVYPDYDGMDDDDDDDDDDLNDNDGAGEKLKMVSDLLTKGKFNYIVSKEGNYELGKQNQAEFIIVSLNNETDLKRMYELLKDKEDVYGSIQEIQREPLSNHQEAYYKKMYDRALKEANVIAKVSMATVDRMISVSEKRGELDKYMEIYSETMKMLPFGNKPSIELSGTKMILEKTFVFEIK